MKMMVINFNPLEFEFIYNVPSEFTFSGREDMKVMVVGDEKSITMRYNGKEIWDVNEKGIRCIGWDCERLSKKYIKITQ